VLQFASTVPCSARFVFSPRRHWKKNGWARVIRESTGSFDVLDGSLYAALHRRSAASQDGDRDLAAIGRFSLAAPHGHGRAGV